MHTPHRTEDTLVTSEKVVSDTASGSVSVQVTLEEPDEVHELGGVVHPDAFL
jgi:hypothetical protein